MLRPRLTCLALTLPSLLALACGDSSSTGDGAGGGTSTSSGVGGGIVGPTAFKCEHTGSGTEYAVGPGQTYAALGEVPTESLKGGDTLRIFYRPEPYREKLMIGGQGTPEQPIVVCGVPGPNGELPIIDGDGATTRATADYPYDGHQVRGVVTLGHHNSAPYEETPGPFVLAGLAVTGGLEGNSFTDASGSGQQYSSAAAGIFVQRGQGVTIRDCEVYGNANGIFSGTSGGAEGTYDVLIEGNYVHDNGTEGSDRQHNVYDESIGITYQFNRFGPPRAGTLGGNVKDRSAGVVFRYNWVDGGAHLLDLVDAQEAKDTTVPDPSFHETFVYGNVFIRRGLGGSMIHYGGDSGILEDYRKGTLQFFANTVVVDNATQGDYDLMVIVELSTNEEQLWSRDNVYWLTTPTTPLRGVVLLGPRDGDTNGVADTASDWIDPGITPYRQVPDLPDTFYGTIDGFATQPTGADPGFVAPGSDDFHPRPDSMLVGAGEPLMGEVPAEHVPTYDYRPHQAGEARSDADEPTIGALAP